VDGIAKELGGYGADKVMVCDSPLLKDYTTDAYAKVVCDMVNEYKPEVLLIGATNIGRDLGPRCAARLHTGLTADATHLDIDTAKYIDFLKESSSSMPLLTSLLMPRPTETMTSAPIRSTSFSAAFSTLRTSVLMSAADSSKAGFTIDLFKVVPELIKQIEAAKAAE